MLAWDAPHFVRQARRCLQAVAGASSLEEVISAHEHFLARASGIAFTAPQQTSELLITALRRLLALAWEFSANASSARRQVPSVSPPSTPSTCF